MVWSVKQWKVLLGAVRGQAPEQEVGNRGWQLRAWYRPGVLQGLARREYRYPEDRKICADGAVVEQLEYPVEVLVATHPPYPVRQQWKQPRQVLVGGLRFATIR